MRENRFLLLLTLVLFVSSLNAQKIRSRNVTFNNKHLLFGAGVSTSPFSFLAEGRKKLPIKNLFRFNAKFEIVLNPKYSFNFGYAFENYNFQTFGYGPVIATLAKYNTVSVKTTGQMNSMQFHFRKYTLIDGTFAPQGRYMFFGLTLSRGGLNIDSYKYNDGDDANVQLEYSVPKTKITLGNYRGVHLGIGNKHFFGKNMNKFFETQLSFEIRGYEMERDRMNAGNNVVISTAIDNILTHAQTNSLFQLSLIYGFAI